MFIPKKSKIFDKLVELSALVKEMAITFKNIASSISQLYFNPENMSPDSDGILTGHVQEALQKHHGEKLIPLAKAMEAYGGISKDDTRDTLRTLAQKVGQALGTNLIMAGNVWRFKERVGSAAGA